MKTNTKSIKEQLQELTLNKQEIIFPIEELQVEKLNKSDIVRSPKKVRKSLKENGGARVGAGRPPKEATLIKRGIKALVEDHCSEEVEVEITDTKTGKVRIIKKPRIVFIMEMLFEAAYEDRNISAAKEWLDRAIGKAVQPKEDYHEYKAFDWGFDIHAILDKAYGKEEEK